MVGVMHFCGGSFNQTLFHVAQTLLELGRVCEQSVALSNVKLRNRVGSMKTKILAAMGTAVAIALGASAAVAGPTLNAVKQKGFVQCGVNPACPASRRRQPGQLDRPRRRYLPRGRRGRVRRRRKVKFMPLTAQQRFTALQSGEIDILSRNTTWTLTRDASLGLNFTGVTYYDGQGFMVPKKLGEITSASSSTAPPSACSPARRPRRTSPTTSRRNKHESSRSCSRVDEANAAYLRRPLPGLHDRRVRPRVDRAYEMAREPRRLRHPAGADLEGAARPGGAPRRRRVASRSSSGSIYATDRGRGDGHHAGQRRRA